VTQTKMIREIQWACSSNGRTTNDYAERAVFMPLHDRPQPLLWEPSPVICNQQLGDQNNSRQMILACNNR
jgi:hypothetical protein